MSQADVFGNITNYIDVVPDPDHKVSKIVCCLLNHTTKIGW